MLAILLSVALAVVLYATSSWVSSSKRSMSYPPTVPTLLPWIGAAISYLSDPNGFLAGCHKRYGSVFKILLGGRDVVVVSSPAAIFSIYASDIAVPHFTHNQVFRAVIGRNERRTKFNLERDLFPHLDQALPKRALGDVTRLLAQMIYARIEPYTRAKETNVSLMPVLAQPLFDSLNIIFFGNRWPTDTYYDDFHILDLSMPKRLSGEPFWFFPSMQARKRLLAQNLKFVDGFDASEHNGILGGNFMKAFLENDVCRNEAACHILTFVWGSHANTHGVVFWFFLFLLSDSVALTAVREEVDKAMKDIFGDLQGFLADASPDNLDGPHFTLLTSALLEAMRLVVKVMGLRVATRDFDLKDGDKAIPVRKGEFLLGNIDAAHSAEESYPDNMKFIYDRFAHSNQRDATFPTEGKPWFALGSGRHVCKGKYLAIYELKVVAILYLYLFNITPVGGIPGPWWPLPPQRRVIGVPHVEKVIVQLRPRHATT
ncbi:cytochrome P450 [Scleroderma yunnanense]